MQLLQFWGQAGAGLAGLAEGSARGPLLRGLARELFLILDEDRSGLRPAALCCSSFCFQFCLFSFDVRLGRGAVSADELSSAFSFEFMHLPDLVLDGLERVAARQ